MSYWEKVNSIADLKALSIKELNCYALEVREHIIEVVTKNGGHLASNLGTVEMTIALHYVFDSPSDKIIWDVGHQAYTHKIITERRDSFSCLRENGGISGFPKPSESEHDAFVSGHSSTSLSAGLGLARARDLNGQNYNVVSVIGDGAMTGGMAYEAINDIGASQKKLLIILNDNKMSISKNVGAFSKYLSRLRLSKRYAIFKNNIKRGVSALPFFGDKLVKFMERTKDNLKSILLTNKLFENFGIKYYGPFDGHDLQYLIKIFSQVKNENRPILLHVLTNKGNGFVEAQTDPQKYHGVSPNDEADDFSFAKDFSDKICELAKNDRKITAVTAAMEAGTGLHGFFSAYPSRAFDVAIAEQHAVTMAAGMAAGGLKPFFAVYSTFLQRGYDQLLHDVCLSNLPVTFMIERAGAVGADGVTHQGVFDLSYLSMMPNMTICAPKDGNELKQMCEFAVTFGAPLAIRYPKNYHRIYSESNQEPLALGKWEFVAKAQSGVYILAVGNRMLDVAHQMKNASIVNARFIKPLDREMLNSLNQSGNLLITMEDNVVKGGFGESVLSYLNGLGLNCRVVNLGYSGFVDDFDIASSIANAGMNKDNLAAIIDNFYKSSLKLPKTSK